MMAAFEIGLNNLLTIARKSPNGLYLIKEPGGESVLLPNQYVTSSMKLNDEIKVFVYKDSENRLVATTESPLIYRDSFGMLKIKSLTSFGAFASWGLLKDLLIPYKLQDPNVRLQEGQDVLVYMFLDEASDRLVGSTYMKPFLSKEDHNYNIGDSVDILIYDKSEIGYNAIVDNSRLGLIYNDEIYQKVKIGDRRKAFVKKRRPDKKLDLSLQALGYENIQVHVDSLLTMLEQKGGKLGIGDKSDPDRIKRVCGMSKKLFKKVAGKLYKDGRLKLKPNSIELVD